MFVTPLYGGGFATAFFQLLIFYYGCGALLHFVVPRILPVKHVQCPDKRKPGDVERDALFSLGPIAVKAAVWTFVEELHAAGISKLYEGQVKSPASVLYLLATVAVLDILHDTWFYWTHRFLHWRPIYVNVHYIHHRSGTPNAFTGYSFHVAEALLVFANEVIVCFLFPIHMGLHRIYHLFTTIIHEGGHAGYEIAPFIPTFFNFIWMLTGGGTRNAKMLNTVQHHDMHHRFPLKHFSLYFTHWDRLCGTIHPNYDSSIITYF